MKKAALVFVLFLAMAGVAFAAQDEATSENLVPDLGTYAGIAALTTIVIGAIKKFWGEWTKGKEPFLAIGIPVILGVLGKLVSAGFGDVSWANHVIALVLAGVGSGLIHDKLVNPLMKGKETGSANPS
jgi:hypothetical protein